MDIQEIGMSLIPPFKVEKLQTALHTKAKNSPDYRFYALYDKLYRRDILEWALVRCRKNGGIPKVDGQSFGDIDAYGQDRWLDELMEELRNETYHPRPVRRVLVPKGDSKLGPLGIPCIKGGRNRRDREPPSNDSDQGPRNGYAARCSDFPIVIKYLDATLCEGMEDGRA
jgi:hypothetical protein